MKQGKRKTIEVMSHFKKIASDTLFAVPSTSKPLSFGGIYIKH